MRTSNINISVRLDEDNVPELITWNADDKKDSDPSVVEAINLSFWDGLIVASALFGNANILYSEDMQDGLMIDNQLTIINPFKTN